MEHFDVIKARIAQSLLPNGYVVVKGEESTILSDGDYVKGENGEWVKRNTDEDTFTKAEVMERMDSVEEQMNEIEELHKDGSATKVDDQEYVRLNKMYNVLHNKYKSM